MEKTRWRIDHKYLKLYTIATNTFMNMFIKQRIVSTPSLAHGQATVIQESEYTEKLNIIKQEISPFTSKYI